MPTSGWGAPEPTVDRQSPVSGSRRLLKRLTDVVAEPITPQQRLDRITAMIASNLVAEVCSVYFYRAGDVLELFATEGLAKEAVHRTRMRVGEGLVGSIASQGVVINTADAEHHPNFRYFPETREELYRSFLGVPIVRSGRVAGVLTVQNRASRQYGEEEVEAMQVIASVIAEMFASGELVDAAKYADVGGAGRTMLRLDGLRLVEGVALGQAWLHEPRIEVTRLVADDVPDELGRLDTAIGELRHTLDELLSRHDLRSGEERDVLEAYRMFAHDTGWLRRIREAIETGLTAEAAVRRVQEETRVRIGHASDPYMRERLLDLEDLADRLLRHLSGMVRTHDDDELPNDVIVVARQLSPADLLEYDRTKLRGIVLEEGSRTAHVTVVARAFDIPMLGRVAQAMDLIDPGDLLALDAEHGQVIARPGDEVQHAFQGAVKARAERRRFFSQLRDAPSVTRDGIAVSLSINAAFLLDLGELEATGADGCGLYRTELSFMTRASFPDVPAQTAYYAQVMAQAGGRPVAFRTLDVGSDKHLPYWRMPDEDNPAMGWRAIRMMLDRPALLRHQLRALIGAADGGPLTVMFPMVAEVAELIAARDVLERELRRTALRQRPLPEPLRVGVMMEVPSLYFQLTALLPRVDFISIGSNDLLQFLFACDRGNPLLVDRYDVLSPSVIRLISDLVERCRAAGVRLSVCGEMASRPLEALALVGAGVRHLSLAPAEVGPVKAMIRSLEAGRLAHYLAGITDLPDRSLRSRLQSYAYDHAVVLPRSVYDTLS